MPFQRIDALSLGDNSHDVRNSFVSDEDEEFGYFAVDDDAGVKIKKVRFSDFSIIGETGIDPNRFSVKCSAIDTINNIGYWGTLGNPPYLYKIDLNTMTQISSLSLAASDRPFTASIDVSDGFLYIGTAPVPGNGRILKIDTESFTQIDQTDPIPDIVSIISSVIDTTNGFAYFGGNSSPAKLAKLRLSDFTIVDTITMDPGENSFLTGVIDIPNQFAYFGTNTSPGKVVKINLSTFIRDSSITFDSGENSLYSGVISPLAGFSYWGCDTDPGIVVKVRHSDFTRVESLSLNPLTEICLDAAAIDTINGNAYFGTNCFAYPVYAVKIHDDDMTPSITGILDITSEPSGAVIYIDDEFTGLLTPQSIELEQGIHSYKLIYSGYKDSEGIFTIVIGETTDINVIMEPQICPTPNFLWLLVLGFGVGAVISRR